MQSHFDVTEPTLEPLVLLDELQDVLVQVSILLLQVLDGPCHLTRLLCSGRPNYHGVSAQGICCGKDAGIVVAKAVRVTDHDTLTGCLCGPVCLLGGSSEYFHTFFGSC